MEKIFFYEVNDENTKPLSKYEGHDKISAGFRVGRRNMKEVGELLREVKQVYVSF